MLNFSNKLDRWEHLWSKQNIIYWAFGWSALSLLTYIFFSGPAQGAERPFWYRIFTAYILQNVPSLVAGLLCLRNGLSRRMPSGSRVWLLMGIALISYFVGNIFFSSWELVWHLNSTGSLGDPFFTIFYICLSFAMVLAIASKRVRLNIYQWAIVVAIGVYAATIAMWILKPAVANLSAPVEPSVSIVQTQNAATVSDRTTAPDISKPESNPTTDAPRWVMFFDGILKPYGQKLNIFYVWCDVALFVLAVIMILGFWGGRLSNAWQINAQAIICFYIADMWFAYAANQIKDYQVGFMLEVFWILGSIQFGVAAGIEFEHMRSRQKYGGMD
ncbi:hypothetical protein [Chamaesiphon sp. VAR_48_metabat_135_sub]|uniref:hypothetical protein n=1 Tax=Chamaesiphon sp. VAR_48_metabat_135_sub TaxID=2964699 RepID=UPI00286AFE93|nr:hypothetical protein [Chamaesiphon sp. VAR_48_metabat_135_sub]